MKSQKILIFFGVVVLSLTMLCVVFPADGVTIGKLTIRFPKLHKVLVREKEVAIEDLLVVEEAAQEMDAMSDSIAYYRSLMDSSAIRFWFPNDDPSFFDKMFAQMEQAKEKVRIIRVLHYGDSQIEMDRMSVQLREYFQNEFGGGGPGLLPFKQSIASLTVSQSASGSLICQTSFGETDSLTHRANGNYGPMTKCYRVSGSATASIKASKQKNIAERMKHFSKVTLLFNNRPGPLTATLVDQVGSYSNKQECSEEGVHSMVWNLDSASTSLKLNIHGSADVYGMMVDCGPGVAVDNIAMRGCSGQQFTMINADQLADAYKQMDVGLIIMQFGGNSVPYLNSEKSLETYCTNLGKQIDRLHEVCPKALILFVGPSDMSKKVDGEAASYPYLPKIVEGLREMALEHGAAYWSIYDAMGGRNSMAVWVKNGLANTDHIHFSNKGVAIMGGYLCDAFARMYEFYNFRKDIPKTQFDSIWRAQR